MAAGSQRGLDAWETASTQERSRYNMLVQSIDKAPAAIIFIVFLMPEKGYFLTAATIIIYKELKFSNNTAVHNSSAKITHAQIQYNEVLIVLE